MANPYEVAIHLSMQNGVSPILATIAKEMLGLSMSAKKLEESFSKMGVGMVAVGGAASIAGYELGKMTGDALKAGGELVKQQMLLRNMGGISEAQILHTTALAQLDTQKIIGTTIAENVKGMREMMGVMPNLREAQDRYPDVMQAAKVLESYTGTPAEKSLQTLAKAIELRGGGTDPVTRALDPARFADEARAATAAVIASGGLVSADKLLQTIQQAGPMAKMVSNPDTFYKSILTAIMDMGGFRSGTALTAIGRQLLGGKMGLSTAQEMERLGLLTPGQWHKAGTGVYVKPGGLVGEDIMKDPNKGFGAYFNDVVLPAFAAHGYTKNADVMQELYRAFGTETARRLAGLYIQNSAQVGRDAGLYDAARGQVNSAYGNVASGDYAANIKNVQDSFANLMQAAGAPIVPVAIKGLQGVADVLNSLAKFAVEHPEMTKLAGEAALVTSGLLGVGGALVALSGSILIVRAALGLGRGGSAPGGVPGGVPAIVPTGGLSWFAKMANVALPIATLAYENEIKTGFINPLLARMFGAPGAGPASLSELRSSLFRPEMNLLTPTMIDASYRRQNLDPGNRRADPEAAHGNAYANMPPPVLNLTNNVKVTLDGRAIAAAVESQIVRNNRDVDGPNWHDGSAGLASTDMQ